MQARRTDEVHPALGRFVKIDGVRLRDIECGDGEPVLLHANGAMVDDFVVSGVLDQICRSYRAIAFDQPGFGHSERPRDRWLPRSRAYLSTEGAQKILERP